MDTLKIKQTATWRTLCLAAADMVRRCGHTQGCPRGTDDPVCAIVALWRAQRMLGCGDAIYNKALAIASAACGDHRGLVVWNQTQDAASVIAMFESAALERDWQP